jgi:hypothetical protein
VCTDDVNDDPGIIFIMNKEADIHTALGYPNSPISPGKKLVCML